MSENVATTIPDNSVGRRARTRKALIDAGERLLTENFSDVSVDDLVAAADVAKGTFYNHFTDKADLFQAVVSTVRDDLRETILKEVTDTEDPARKCIKGFCVAVRYMMSHPQRRQIILMSQHAVITHFSESNEGIVSFIAEGIAANRFRIATVEAGVLLNFALVEICAAMPLSEADAFATIARVQQLGAMLLRGLGLSYEESELLSAQETDRTIRSYFSRPAAAAAAAAAPEEEAGA